MKRKGEVKNNLSYEPTDFLKLILFSALGIFMFFIQIQIGEKKTIPIDHIVTWIRTIPYYTKVYGFIMITLGTILPFSMGTWKKSITTKIFALLNILGLITAYMVIFGFGPEFLMREDMSPFVFNVVVVPVVTIVPVGSVFLSFLVSYGLMEFIGVFMRTVMKPIWRTPGRSAIDAVASFVGSYSLALLVTNRVYKEGKYSTREASIIATGFSTVSATFMIITAKTLGIIEYWTIYFWITLLVTFIVTAITARIYPLNSISATYYENQEPKLESNEKGKLFQYALSEAMSTLKMNPGVIINIKSNFIDGLKLALNIGPSIMSIGIISLILANYTMVFDVMGYAFYPLTSLLKIPEAMLVAKGSAITLADMYVPAIISTNADFHSRFIIAIICISEILFFSASIPCILSTEIPIKVKDIVIIWFERVVLSIIVATPLVYLFFGMP